VTELAAPPLYARDEFRRVAGDALRPGGLDLTRRALDLLRLPPGALVLDAGCGPGATARLLAGEGCRVLALDRAPELAPGEGVAVVRADLTALPLAAGRLDAAFCECALSACGDADAALKGLAAALRPGGRLALSDLYLRGGAASAAPGGCLGGARGRDELERGLREAGLELTLFEDHSRLLAELAGRLILAGLPLDWLGCGGGGGCGGGSRPGYFLCLARKP
jgi:SAM-dependent methyltransferase